MATYTPTKLHDGALTTSSVTLYTTPTGGAIIKEIILANTTGSVIYSTVTVGGTTLIPGVSLSPNGLQTYAMSKVVANGDLIAGLASAAGVNIFISGVVIS